MTARAVLPALLALWLAACSSAPVSRVAERASAEAIARRGYVVEFVGFGEDLDDRPRDAAVERALDEYEESGRESFYVDDAAYALEEALRERGHAEAAVAWEVHEADGAPDRVVFTATPGPIYALESVSVDGLDTIPHDEAVQAFDFPLATTGDRQGAVYTEQAARGGTGRLVERLYVDGYLDARVRLLEPELLPDPPRARVRIEVEEGVQYLLRAVAVDDGGTADDEALEALWEPLLDEPFTPRVAWELQNELAELYGQLGRAQPVIRFERTGGEARGEVRLAYTVVAGPAVTITDVRIENPDGKSREDWVRDRVGLDAGDAWTREEQRHAFTRLWKTGVFDGVSVELGEAGEDPSERPLVVTLSEFPSREVWVEPGYGSYEEFRVRAGFRERNLFGSGRGLRLEGLLSVKSSEALIGLTDPEFFDDDLLADLTFKVLEREEPSFTREEYTAALALSWPIGPRVEGLFRYQFTDSRATDIQVNDPAAVAAEDDLDISSITFAPRYDSRDNVLMPSEGVLGEVALEWGGSLIGSELDFVRPSANLTTYVPFDADGDTALGLTLRTGVIVPTGDLDPIPIQERYFNGGSNTVRAFEQDELGPVDSNGEPLGGETFGLLSLELRQRLRGRLYGALFVDAGTVESQVADYLKFTDPRWGPGLGIRYLTPVGPLRLDVAWNPDPRANESDVVAHFAFGVAF